MAIALSVLAAGCGSSTVTTPDQGASAPHGMDVRTPQALLHVAIAFNEDYAANRDGAVYDQWDAGSQAVISRHDYITRHHECPTAPGAAIVQSATPSPGGYWRVRYSIGGSPLTDYWHYVGHRWKFDLARSNPDAVALYRLPFPAYARAVGCSAR